MGWLEDVMSRCQSYRVEDPQRGQESGDPGQETTSDSDGIRTPPLRITLSARAGCNEARSSIFADRAVPVMPGVPPDRRTISSTRERLMGAHRPRPEPLGHHGKPVWVLGADTVEH